jgi:hypothetical protein
VVDFSVRINDMRLVATPANAVCDKRWIEVFFDSSATGPKARVASRRRLYLARTSGADLVKCASTLIATPF